jgi:hypothetical protein
VEIRRLTAWALADPSIYLVLYESLNKQLLFSCTSLSKLFKILWHVNQLLGCAAGVAQWSVARQPSAKKLATKHSLRGSAGRRALLRAVAMTPLNRLEYVSREQPRWRHTAARSLPRQRCYKHGEATQLSPLVRLRVYKRNWNVLAVSFRKQLYESSFVRSSPTSEVSIGDRHVKCVIIWHSNW